MRKSEEYPNGLEKVLNSINRLQAAGYNSISVGSVVLDNNVDQLVKLCHFVKSEKIRNIRFTAFSPVGYGKIWEKEELRITDPDFLRKLKETIGQLKDFKKQYQTISNSNHYLRRIPEYYESGFNYFPFRCVIGYYNVQIMANGDVPMCPFRMPSSILGNVKYDSLADLWYSDKGRMERLKIKNKSCPTCWLSCFAENNMRFSMECGLPVNHEAFKRALCYKL